MLFGNKKRQVNSAKLANGYDVKTVHNNRGSHGNDCCIKDSLGAMALAAG